MRFRWVLVGGLLVAGGLVAAVINDAEPRRTQYCVAQVGDLSARTDLEQAKWTTLMSAIADRRGLPPRATTIAIATAYQESRIHNIDYGDRDSLGLFQQRPSQGWGAPEQVMDPTYAINRFYDGLVQVPDYVNLPITEAAQAVQRSAYPDAYADHEPFARALASAQRGHSPASFTCHINPVAGGSVTAIVAALEGAYGPLPNEPAEDGNSVRLPVGDTAEPSVRGWALAHFLVGNAAELRIEQIAFDGMSWSADDYEQGWTEDDEAPADAVVARVS
ncbi:hypothetical protein EHW97_11075 [Aeromicrobium camelliae]|uniref:Heavy metal transporter n=1 Tax=Aeromicrobium camelliae TaxID=1538144 RepID=A0A3N6W627_9ACTN|nr:hypothetical protein [Aeromicrobium camelliae]RQN02970.1 hypothetical protein EHW97_11075 [Aeromicrobium camelliae]